MSGVAQQFPAIMEADLITIHYRQGRVVGQGTTELLRASAVYQRNYTCSQYQER